MELSKHRFESFSDGVMAIIITIMVLEIPIPKDFTFESILSFLYFIFIFFVSFFIVGSFWNKHHFLIDKIDKITNKLTWKNLVFLFFLALLPIFTKWVLEYPTEIVPVLAYDILYILVYTSYFQLFNEAVKENGLERPHGHEGSETNRHFLLLFSLLIIFIISFFIFPEISIILFMGFPVLFALLNLLFEDRRFLGRKR
ncbi:TMEM175 family protein [Methanobrevibacter sp. DSM 116169]|uniref:TMEM175 family protein n=1 Tax=Methanobrevibacter sp. DSM 116169 TaxID=3242727 RepID=UPI0038FD220E